MQASPRSLSSSSAVNIHHANNNPEAVHTRWTPAEVIFKAIRRVVLSVAPKASRTIGVPGKHINNGMLTVKMGSQGVFAGAGMPTQMAGYRLDLAQDSASPGRDNIIPNTPHRMEKRPPAAQTSTSFEKGS